ncbi:hypothetical protein GE253_13135 [Niveispirillum sp. SYP-B3756]|uniref:hypothetical protein n=1 Tax=Niveispirillum sp. SYP-B3756 TaxID=2662178 RepID=UPI00129149BE|nr:hypothetical protein [Niveispirillum sp. SYP-B3756]MQP66285.1 hypothetical protein [Niveispirillum sp. SYP-B3756]
MNVDFRFGRMSKLLRKPVTDPEVIALANISDDVVNKSAHSGFINFKNIGLTIMLKEAPWVINYYKPGDETVLYVDGIHFYSEGYEEHAKYSEEMPHGLNFGDTKDDVLKKMGEPYSTGGGNYVKLLNKNSPMWIKYMIGDDVLHIQINNDERVDLVSLSVITPAIK